MKKVKIGQFHTNGKLLVTDPCYETDSDSIKKLTVKSGVYNAFVLLGQLNANVSVFRWDQVRGNHRNAELIIIHSDFKGKLNFKKAKSSIDVDSGQAGFFNLSTYKNDSFIDVDLINENYDFYKNEITSATMKIWDNEKALKEKDKNPLYAKLKQKNTDAQIVDLLSTDIEIARESIAEDKKILKTKKYPDFLKTNQSKDFYDIMCDQTDSEFHAGVNGYGAVSRTGLGDGCYDLYVAKNSKGIIVASYISFLKRTDLVG
jgi:hypothetical protein